MMINRTSALATMCGIGVMAGMVITGDKTTGLLGVGVGGLVMFAIILREETKETEA